LRERELDIHLARVTEHHHEDAQGATGVAHRNRAAVAPVNLSTFARGKG
jgi:hypothetical protein